MAGPSNKHRYAFGQEMNMLVLCRGEYWPKSCRSVEVCVFFFFFTEDPHLVDIQWYKYTSTDTGPSSK